jgi:hypothetical protein
LSKPSTLNSFSILLLSSSSDVDGEGELVVPPAGVVPPTGVGLVESILNVFLIEPRFVCATDKSTVSLLPDAQTTYGK